MTDLDCTLTQRELTTFAISQTERLSTCRLTNRWEASLWLNGRQLYLGGFNSEADAARAYDIVALSCKGLHVATNFEAAAYTAELAELAQSSQVCEGLHASLGLIDFASGTWLLFPSMSLLC